MTEDHAQRLAKLETTALSLAEKLTGVEAKHEALANRNASLLGVIRKVRQKVGALELDPVGDDFPGLARVSSREIHDIFKILQSAEID